MISALVLLLLADFEVVRLDSPPEVAYRVIRDLDADGIDDLVVVTNKEAWFWHGRRGPLPASPDRRMALPQGTALFDFAPDGALVVRTAQAYLALRPQPERLLHASGPGLPARPTNVLWRGFFHDFDLDGKTDFLDVSLRGYAITPARGDRMVLPPVIVETVDTDVDAASERLVARYAIGDWTQGDFTGDGRNDFAVILPDGLRVYSGDADGRFDAGRSLEIKLAEAKKADLRFLDLNGDLRTDVLAVNRPDGEATLLIGDAQQGLRRPRRVRLTVPGFMRFPVIDDINGDGRPDLALPYTSRPSIQDAVRVVARGEVIVKVPLFLNRGGASPIARLANRQLAIPMRIRAGSDETGRIKLSALVVVEYGGDLDGDGRKDLLVTLSPELLAIYPGIAGQAVFAGRESLQIPIPDCSEYDSVKSAAANLNGDDRSDIILHYRGAGRRPDRLYLLLSGKK